MKHRSPFLSAWMASLAEDRRRAAPADLDAPIALVEAAALPELGGMFTVKMLRGAIARGDLAAEMHTAGRCTSRAAI